jgi:hypothetical protein
MVYLVVCQNPSLHVRLVFLVVKPEFSNDNYLKVVVDVLHFISFVEVKVILELKVSLDIVEFANLVKGI